MSTLSNPLSILSSSAEHQGELAALESANDDRRAGTLKSAMSAAENRLQISETLQAKAESDLMEEKLVRQLEDVLARNEELAEAQDPETETEDYLDTQSARVLELRRKHEECGEMRTKIREGTTLLNNLANHADLIFAYLEKAEVELMQLESVEAKSARLNGAAVDLARKYQEMQATIEEQKQQISILEAQKKASRDMIETARLEIGRLQEEKNAQAATIISHETNANMLQDEKLALIEKAELRERELGEQGSEIADLRDRVDSLSKLLQNKDRDLAKSAASNDELKQTKARLTVDLTDLQSKYGALKARHMDQKSLLDERSFELEAAMNEYQEKLRLKEKRIIELESKIEVTSKQLFLSEEMIASISHKLEDGAKEVMDLVAQPEDDERPANDD